MQEANRQVKFLSSVDWALLLFLLGVTYVKLYVKVLAVLFYFLYLLIKKVDFKAITGIQKFYLGMIFTGSISAYVTHSFGVNGYWLGYLMSILNWLLAFLASYFIYLSVVNSSDNRLIRTIETFFIVNFFVCLLQLSLLIIESGHIIPYWYWEATEKFGASTGDNIRGVFGNISVTNAFINLLGCIFFLYRSSLKLSIMCLVVLLMCTSNLTLVFFLFALLCVFIFVGRRVVRRNCLILLVFGLGLYPFLSPANIKYIETTYSQGTSEKKKQLVDVKDSTKVSLGLRRYAEDEYFKGITNYDKNNYYTVKAKGDVSATFNDDLKYTSAFGRINKSNNPTIKLNPVVLKEVIRDWYGVKHELTPLSTYKGPIKIYSHFQTLYFIKRDWKNFVFGAGINNFSSKQAIKMTGLNLQGTYPTRYIYINKNFFENHFYTLLYVFALPISEHSIINMPNSVYNQIGGEYGVLGILLFLFFYIGFFWTHRKSLGAGKFLLPIALLCFGFEYWFESLTFTVVFELLMFQNIFKQEDVVEQS